MTPLNILILQTFVAFSMIYIIQSFEIKIINKSDLCDNHCVLDISRVKS